MGTFLSGSHSSVNINALSNLPGPKPSATLNWLEVLNNFVVVGQNLLIVLHNRQSVICIGLLMSPFMNMEQQKPKRTKKVEKLVCFVLSV